MWFHQNPTEQLRRRHLIRVRVRDRVRVGVSNKDRYRVSETVKVRVKPTAMTAYTAVSSPSASR